MIFIFLCKKKKVIQRKRTLCMYISYQKIYTYITNNNKEKEINVLY